MSRVKTYSMFALFAITVLLFSSLALATDRGDIMIYVVDKYDEPIRGATVIVDGDGCGHGDDCEDETFC